MGDGKSPKEIRDTINWIGKTMHRINMEHHMLPIIERFNKSEKVSVCLDRMRRNQIRSKKEIEISNKLRNIVIGYSFYENGFLDALDDLKWCVKTIEELASDHNPEEGV